MAGLRLMNSCAAFLWSYFYIGCEHISAPVFTALAWILIIATLTDYLKTITITHSLFIGIHTKPSQHWEIYIYWVDLSHLSKRTEWAKLTLNVLLRDNRDLYESQVIVLVSLTFHVGLSHTNNLCNIISHCSIKPPHGYMASKSLLTLNYFLWLYSWSFVFFQIEWSKKLAEFEKFTYISFHYSTVMPGLLKASSRDHVLSISKCLNGSTQIIR